jgi:hypothetical protein
MGHGAARLDLCNVPCRNAGPYGRRDLHSAARDVRLAIVGFSDNRRPAIGKGGQELR